MSDHTTTGRGGPAPRFLLPTAREAASEDRAAEREAAEILTRDPDLALIVDYAAGELSPEEMERVRARLETDARFRTAAGPILLVWNTPLPSDAPMSEAELDRLRDELLVRLDARAVDTFGELAHDVEGRSAGARGRRWSPWLTTALLAASLLVASVWDASPVTTWLEAWKARSTTGSAALPADRRTGDLEQLEFVLGDETRVRLQPNSRLRSGVITSSSGSREVWLEGEATFTLLPHGAAPFTIHTDMATVVVPTTGHHGTTIVVRAFRGDPITDVKLVDGIVTVTDAAGHSTLGAYVPGSIVRSLRGGRVELALPDLRTPNPWLP